MKTFGSTDVGRQRDHNEDQFLSDDALRLYVVADGMGGHAAGEVASEIAVKTVRTVIEENQQLLEDFGDKKGVKSTEVLSLLEQAVHTACRAVYEEAQKDTKKRGMGTTTSALMFVGERGFIAHVGDSRIYLMRQGQVVQLTEDHSLINELIKRGKVTKDTIETSPYKDYKNAVTRAVGVYESVEVDTLDFDVLPGDVYMVCSDGLHHYLKEPEMPGLLTPPVVPDVTRHLIALANEGGGHDNITAIVVRVESDFPSRPSLIQRNEEFTRKIEALKRMPLFRFLEYNELIRVLNVTEVTGYQIGTTIIREGEEGDAMFLVLTGKVKLSKGDSVIKELGPGEHFGEMALVDRAPRSATATATETSRLLVLKRAPFYEMVKKEHALSVKLLWSFVQVLADRLRKTTAELSGARIEAAAVDLSEDALFED
jgi:serine/threonine protein phosphatase PrpC